MERDDIEILKMALIKLERLESMVMVLCLEARAGKGQMGQVYDDFIDAWRREHTNGLHAL
jgi:hypothetical protein